MADKRRQIPAASGACPAPFDHPGIAGAVGARVLERWADCHPNAQPPVIGKRRASGGIEEHLECGGGMAAVEGDPCVMRD